jgi:hypothetical protein
MVCDAINESPFTIKQVISGCARGVDQMGIRWAKENKISFVGVPANWDYYGKSAGMIRNTQMANKADALIAIWDGESRGTKHMIDYMYRLEKPVFVWRY